MEPFVKKATPLVNNELDSKNRDDAFDHSVQTHQAKMLHHIKLKHQATVKIDAVLQSIEKALKLDTKAQELSLLMLWPKVVQQVYQANTEEAISKTRALKVANHKGKKQLQVAVADPALLSQLQFCSNALLEKLNQFSPQTGITLSSIQFVMRHHGDYR